MSQTKKYTYKEFDELIAYLKLGSYSGARRYLRNRVPRTNYATRNAFDTKLVDVGSGHGTDVGHFLFWFGPRTKAQLCQVEQISVADITHALERRVEMEIYGKWSNQVAENWTLPVQAPYRITPRYSPLPAFYFVFSARENQAGFMEPAVNVYVDWTASLSLELSATERLSALEVRTRFNAEWAAWFESKRKSLAAIAGLAESRVFATWLWPYDLNPLSRFSSPHTVFTDMYINEVGYALRVTFTPVEFSEFIKNIMLTLVDAHKPDWRPADPIAEDFYAV